MLTMIFIYVLTTESAPSKPSKHALWQSQAGVKSYSLFVQTLTISLIGFGVSYKSFLHEIYQEVVEDKEVEYVKSSKCFSGFLTVVILSLELINLSHGGFKNAFEYLFQADDGSKRKLNWPVIIVSLLKVGIILFGATAFTWTNHPDLLAIAGILVIIALSATRVFSCIG